jgi:hypothetical protein
MVLAEYKKQVFILNSKPKIEDPVEKRHVTLLMWPLVVYSVFSYQSV